MDTKEKVFLLMRWTTQPQTTNIETDIYGCCLAVDIKEAAKKLEVTGVPFLSTQDTTTSVLWPTDKPPGWFGQVTGESAEHHKARWEKVKRGGGWFIEYVPRVD